MATKRREYPSVYPKDRAAWRAWLSENHAGSSGIWLIFDKKSHNEARLDYGDAVEEALAFGWIDSVANPVDDRRYKQLFTPRKAKSVWSALNKRRIEKVIADGLMTEAGLATIRVAKENGSWTKLDAIEALEMPDDFANALSAKGRANFEAFPPSARKMLLHWISNVKREETRRARVIAAAKAAAANERAPWAPSGAAKTRASTPAAARAAAKPTARARKPAAKKKKKARG
jgi:uncharacterized protein YdeI (YjbR/CyaY-like superfamily)